MTKSKIVRTPTRAEGGITDAERAAMAEHTKMWIARVMRTEPAYPDRVCAAIEGLYAASGLKKPRVVLVPSPRVMAFAGGRASAIWHMRKTGTLAATYDATLAATDAATDAATRSATDGATYDATEFEKFALDCANRWYTPYQGGNMWGSWECYVTAARDILGLRLPEHEKYHWWEQASIEGGFRWMHEEFCMVSDFPETLKVDEENRPHSETGPSHKWRDGWSLYHWHGTVVPSDWIEGTPSAAEVLQAENIEQRRAGCEIVGWDTILSELNAKTIDQDEDPEIGTLLEVDLPDAGRERFLRVTCGTGRTFAIPVPPEMTTALQANSWTYGFDSGDFIKPEIRT